MVLGFSLNNGDDYESFIYYLVDAYIGYAEFIAFSEMWFHIGYSLTVAFNSCLAAGLTLSKSYRMDYYLAPTILQKGTSTI